MLMMTLPAKDSTWIVRTPISTFVHSLHLLDLDLCGDWPGLTTETFSSRSNLQQRLRSVEWSLYRLFELHDSRLTKDKLLPFFPPTTSLQSINLRAALFRQLTELKKDGRLGQNVILRKTMLDECKGDKFEEVLAAFSIFVLKKSKSLTTDRFNISKLRQDHLLPLIISHRKAIERDLIERKQSKLKAQAQRRSLATTLERLTTEESELKQRKVSKLPENAEWLCRTLLENWVGDAGWVETILNGVQSETLYNESRTTYTEDGTYDDEGDSSSDLLSDLQSRVVTQNARLAHWQRCLEDLQRQKRSEPPNPDESDRLKHIRGPIFSQHQKLELEPVLNIDQELNLTPQHAALLQSLERELTHEAPRPLMKSYCVNQQTEALKSRSKNTTNHSGEFTGTAISAADITRTTSTMRPETSPFSLGHKNQSATHHIVPPDTPKALPTSIEDQIFRSSTPPPPQNYDTSSLTRTQTSIAEPATPENPRPILKRSASSASKAINHTTIMTASPKQLDKSTLFQRTRESMSLLTRAVDKTQSRRKSGPRRSFHSKSKSVNLPAQDRKLEQAWSEELATAQGARDDIDVEADYESVFMSRPKLAMSPNLSPQRNNLFEEFLEEGMKNLRIEPTP